MTGWNAALVRGLCVALSGYALYWVVGIVPAQIYRPTFLLIALVITFLSYPAVATRSTVASAVDWALVLLASAALVWPIVEGDPFVYRAATPEPVDVVLGVVLVLVVLEATRRTVGWILPITAAMFLAYAQAGPLLDRIGLTLIAHRGYSLERVVGMLYMTLEGILGVPLDVAATYIVLFTIYGAVVEHSGAGRFFVDWALSAMGRTTSGAAGRTVTLAGYLLGSVSGSGVANTVMLGSVCWPMMRRAGYPADTGGAVLAAAGLGAILAPPVMGAAAFLIAESLRISYYEVLQMAVLPAALYYLAIVVTVEAESRRLGLRQPAADARSFVAVTRQGWYYFASLAAIAAMMASGVTAFRAVFWATVVAAAVSFLNRELALRPRRLLDALASGGASVVPVVATTAAAGIIVGVVTLTGLGLKAASLIVALAGGNLLLTVVYAALGVWVLGLAVPVTACYIISAVMVAPALTQVGIAPVAAHMFVFYYSVLSEVSPPTALSPFAAAAITGGNPFRTTMVTWRYTVPAFLVPFAFTLTPGGGALLLQGSVADILRVTVVAAVGVALIGAGTGGYLHRPLSTVYRAAAIAAGVALLFTGAR
jgi:TRAP transporter 4TM/12TM fusion protein